MDLEQRFQERIDAGEKIEPRDPMPEKYRKQLIRMIGQHAHSEFIGMYPEGAWISKAPNLRRKLSLLAKVQDEAGHGLYLYSSAETLGTSRERMLDDLISGKAKYSSIFNYPTITWADVAIIGWLVDGAAIVNQTMLAQASYGPYSRAMKRICVEENFHKRQGKEGVTMMALGTPEQKRMVQDALNRWWWPTLMMFGPHDQDSVNSDDLLKWKVKSKTNDELRQFFIDTTVPELHEIGLTVPDPELKYNEESKHWEVGPIDWDEFWRVVRGNGPCNRERMALKKQGYEDGAWVREAAAAFAKKQAAAASEAA